MFRFIRDLLLGIYKVPTLKRKSLIFTWFTVVSVTGCQQVGGNEEDDNRNHKALTFRAYHNRFFSRGFNLRSLFYDNLRNTRENAKNNFLTLGQEQGGHRSGYHVLHSRRFTG